MQDIFLHRQPINDGVDWRVGRSMFLLITDKDFVSVMFEGSHILCKIYSYIDIRQPINDGVDGRGWVVGGSVLVLITDKGRGRIATCQQAI